MRLSSSDRLQKQHSVTCIVCVFKKTDKRPKDRPGVLACAFFRGNKESGFHVSGSIVSSEEGTSQSVKPIFWSLFCLYVLAYSRQRQVFGTPGFTNKVNYPATSSKMEFSTLPDDQPWS